MGKGDKKSKRGKIIMGSSGVRRQKSKISFKPSKKAQPDKKETEEVVEKKAVKAVENEKPGIKEEKTVMKPAAKTTTAKTPKAKTTKTKAEIAPAEDTKLGKEAVVADIEAEAKPTEEEDKVKSTEKEAEAKPTEKEAKKKTADG
jgi:30S ribosomal protein S31